MKNRSLIMTVAGLLLGLLSVPTTIYGQKSQTAGRDWPASRRVPIQEIDHAVFDKLLKKYVDQDGMVDYKSWHASSNDRNRLKSYISELSKADLEQKSPKLDRLAYWINAYNAITIDGILRVYPTTSIRNHTSKAFGYNIWKHLYFQVDDKRYSLDDIEHKLLRKMGEPRIHFAIVCASISCPRLLDEAYVGNRLESQLKKNTKDFFSRERNLKYDAATNQLSVSSIMSWFGSDFGGSQSEQIAAIYPYFPTKLQQQLAGKSLDIKYLSYDWGLNEQQ